MQGFPSSLTGAPTGSKRENRVLTLVWDLGTGQKGVTLSGCSCFIVSEMWVNTEQIMEIKGSKIGRWLCWSYWWVDDADVGSGGGGNSCWRLSHPPHTSCLRCLVSKTYLSFIHIDSFWDTQPHLHRGQPHQQLKHHKFWMNKCDWSWLCLFVEASVNNGDWKGVGEYSEDKWTNVYLNG